MGRGEHPRQNHHKKVIRRAKNKITYWDKLYKIVRLFSIKKIKNKAYGQLVLLGFDVTTLIPIAYQRHSL